MSDRLPGPRPDRLPDPADAERLLGGGAVPGLEDVEALVRGIRDLADAGVSPNATLAALLRDGFDPAAPPAAPGPVPALHAATRRRSWRRPLAGLAAAGLGVQLVVGTTAAVAAVATAAGAGVLPEPVQERVEQVLDAVVPGAPSPSRPDVDQGPAPAPSLQLRTPEAPPAAGDGPVATLLPGADAVPPAPRDQRPTPQADRPTPQAERPTPQADRPTPQAERPTPQADRPTPQADRPTPQAERPTPQADRPTPQADRPTPGADRPTPAAGRPAPAAQRPSSAAERPAPADQRPDAPAQPGPATPAAPQPGEEGATSRAVLPAGAAEPRSTRPSTVRGGS